MTNIIDANGITIDSLEDLITQYSDVLRNIYGPDIVLDPESPDGLSVNFLAQVTRDISEFAVKLYNSYSINSAVGSLLDQRVAWFGITRKPASYTYVNVNITTLNTYTGTINLVGMDANIEPPPNIYTVQDQAGNMYYLSTSVSLAPNTTTSCSFRAENSGAILVPSGSINSPITYNQYISSINNPSAQYVVGEEEESDTELKWRLKSSYALPSQGFCDSMKATLLSYDDIEDAHVVDNPSNITDALGIPAWSVWVIVDCPDTPQTQDEIGESFATQMTAGTPTHNVSYVNTQMDVDITATADITLVGIDYNVLIPQGTYTIKDANDYVFYLKESTSIASGETKTCTFISADYSDLTALIDTGSPAVQITVNSNVTVPLGNPTNLSTINNLKTKSVTRLNSQGTYTTYNYNLAIPEDIYVYINFTVTESGYSVDTTELVNYIIEKLGNFRINQACNTNDIIKLCSEYDSRIVVAECKLNISKPSLASDPTKYSVETFVNPSNVNKKFIFDSANFYTTQT